jgi:anthraniloyl-CoA monooxygenase
MRLNRIAVVGGGPGGLYAGRLLKLADPTCEVTVYEQGVPDKTFGFGVGLAGRTQTNLAEADPDSLHDIVAAGRHHDMRMLLGRGSVRIRNNNLIAIARTELLAVLQRHAEKAGVVLRFGERVDAGDLEADLVIATDGAGSATRTALAAELDVSVEQGAGLYLWAGADFALDTAIFAPVETEHGTFVTHAYPYADELSTFLIETDEPTWRRAGFDATTEATPADESDTSALTYLQAAFAEHLGGHRLIGNRTRWQRFRTVRCGRWSHGRVVLVGDAAHTAHYSLGSGTKLAMEDAIALVEAISRENSLEAAVETYETSRRPAVERTQELARRSQLWWESFQRRLDMPAESLMLAYMTRAGNVSLPRFTRSTPDAAYPALAQYAGAAPDAAVDDLADWVLAQPLSRGGVTFPRRIVTDVSRLRLWQVSDPPSDPWGEAGDRLVARLRDKPGVLLAGAGDRGAVLTRLEMGERLRRDTEALVVVRAPATCREDLAAGLACGRTDLVTLAATEPEDVS